MQNVKIDIEDGPDGPVGVIRFRINVEGVKSRSNRTTVLASTRGNIPLAGHPSIKVGLNVFKTEDEEWA